MQQPRVRVELRETVARARHDLEQLRNGVHKVDQLRHEEQQQGLAEVPKNAHHGERHSRKIGERVSDKHFGRVPVEDQEGEGGRDERQHEVSGEEVRIADDLVGLVQHAQVVDENRDTDHQALTRFKAIDAGENVDRVGAKDGEKQHVEVVEHAEMDDVTLAVLCEGQREDVAPPVLKQRFQRLRDGDVRLSGVGHQQGHRRHHRKDQLVAPRDV
mmetsp:Transcript_39759/g.66702  ORF Transcript_39759/g.66702 Transcript_39759/m.66702 type:complete len:215 (+) Transcript_39759:831-1475(+)|eukprot:CAMPEP_0198212132 /NCGR_PEP_ID=MMETSP1445-20131203/25539_1 /TAXON_ID=36898 /ORGANISM="Pyramimonas sp., Strain CCMP2087" /LENGTH=214 /DNA_ID=CAMNT_0043886517 /DNA_START=463 /DNA_END=1107 /DNA_ORIENTATION=-